MEMNIMSLTFCLTHSSMEILLCTESKGPVYNAESDISLSRLAALIQEVKWWSVIGNNVCITDTV